MLRCCSLPSSGSSLPTNRLTPPAVTANRGFTIVELVVVIILLGILSITALPKLVQPGAFAPATLSQAIVSQGRLAAQAAVAQPQVGVVLQISRSTDHWQLLMLQDGDVRQQAWLQAHNVELLVSNAGNSHAIQIGEQLDLEFAASGGSLAALLTLIAGGAQPLDAAVGIDLFIQGDSNRRLCIYPNGYVSADSCA